MAPHVTCTAHGSRPVGCPYDVDPGGIHRLWAAALSRPCTPPETGPVLHPCATCHITPCASPLGCLDFRIGRFDWGSHCGSSPPSELPCGPLPRMTQGNGIFACTHLMASLSLHQPRGHPLCSNPRAWAGGAGIHGQGPIGWGFSRCLSGMSLYDKCGEGTDGGRYRYTSSCARFLKGPTCETGQLLMFTSQLLAMLSWG